MGVLRFIAVLIIILNAQSVETNLLIRSIEDKLYNLADRNSPYVLSVHQLIDQLNCMGLPLGIFY